jgi:NtrC-family two-component system response regulator AlgB
MDFLIIDDDKTTREAAGFLIEDEGHYAESAESGRVGLTLLKEERFDAVLLDLHLGAESGLDVLTEIHAQAPGLPVILFTAQGNVKHAVEAMRRGAVDFLEKPFHREQLATVLARVQHLRNLGHRIEKLEQEVTETKAQHLEPVFDFTTPSMRDLMEVLLRSAKTPASILILGESGTGKSVAARAVHDHSHLAEKPFITVSCPSLSKELLESELFGHVKGAFTGAVRDHWGKVKAADGGTLFLDEIGDLPMEIQPKLLRLLQEREYERLGENIIRAASVRIIAATNRDLKQRVATGAFRQDLYFRLNVIAVEMPPLRERPGDLIKLAGLYLNHFASLCGRKFEGLTEEAAVRLCAYGWPGNLRELRNAIERAVILSRGEKVSPTDLPSEVQSLDSNHGANGPASLAGAMISLEKMEELHIRRVVEGTTSLVEAAAVLGIDQATLYRKRKRIGLE